MIVKENSVLYILFALPIMVFGQNGLLKDSVENDSYFSYDQTKVSIGWQSQFQPFVLNSRFTFSVSYSMSNFYYSIESVNNQIGLTNEVGINNFEAYLKFGPELRLIKSFFVIPEGGVSFAWMTGVDRGGIGFLYYYGGRTGLIQRIGQTSNLSIELGTRVIPIVETQVLYYLRIGLLFNLF